MTIKECCQILGVAGTANSEDVKHAYRRRAFELHPDLNPNLADANQHFQLLNEAYVVLMRVLSDKEAKAAETGGKKERAARPEGGARESGQGAGRESGKDTPGAAGPEDADGAAGRRTQTGHKPPTGEAAGASSAKTASAAASGPAGAGESASGESETARKRRMADSAYAQQEDVLRDILKDQFARRVFEDIYSEVNKQQAAREGADKLIPPAPPKPRKLKLEWGDKIFKLDFTGGLSGMMRNWLRRQIDDELTVQLPRGKLFPGARVRLQIRQGFKNELHVVEVILPQDFKVGKAIRLKGLGRKAGKWAGDLYLTIEAQQ